MNTAVLCVGGGAAGLIGAAYLSAVIKSKIQIDQLFGTSVGALNASVLVSSGLEALEGIWSRIENRDVYLSTPLTWLGFAGKQASCYDSKPLLRLVSRYIDSKALGAPDAIPVKVSVTEVENERSAVINLKTLKSDHPLWVFASASPPVFFPPVKIGAKTWVDGGLGSNFNVSNAVANGADRLIVLCPRGKGATAQINNGLDAVKFTIRVPMNSMLEKELKFVEIMNSHPDKRHIEVIMIRPDDANQPSILDFDSLGNRSDRLKLWRKYEDQALNILDNVVPS